MTWKNIILKALKDLNRPAFPDEIEFQSRVLFPNKQTTNITSTVNATLSLLYFSGHVFRKGAVDVNGRMIFIYAIKQELL